MTDKQLDKFYTKTEVAKKCIDLVPNIEQYTKIIEPSAGDGSFSNLLNCVAYDIKPEGPNIIEKDWFTVPKQEGKILVIGNPPFGKRSSLAKDFIKHSIKIGAETIAFILPETFSKISNQSETVFPKNWSLIVEEELPKQSFLINGKEYHVPCRFFVWTKQKTNINLRKIKLPETEDFIFLSRGDENADFCINGNNGKVKEINEVTNSKAEHYIKAKNKTVEELKEIFNNITYTFLSSVNGGNSWIGRQEILEAYYKLKDLIQ